MRPRRLSDVARATDGTLEGEDIEVTSVSTDSRTAPPGSLFVALLGDRTDGHRFVDDALRVGAAAALVHEGRADGPLVRVRSTNDALMRLAADERTRNDATVVGVTGANGKTSTKDLTRAVLATRRRTHASPGSFNNEVGLPLTLLGAAPGTEVIVAEMGARRLGDVKLLCGIARPEVVVVTNVGVAHMEIFGSWASIVEASAEPVEALDAKGTAILNADDPVVATYRERCAGSVVTFGTGAASGADVRAEDVTLGTDGLPSFRLLTPAGDAGVTLAMAGEHMVPNALAAAAVGLHLGITIEDVTGALAAAHISRWRMEASTTAAGVRVVNDAYNANPESTAAALRTARWIAGEARLVAVLGEMAELGPIADVEHERVGELAARIRVDRLVTVGAAAEPIARSAIREGMAPEDVASYEHVDDAVADVCRSAGPGDVVLCKGSRVAGLERVAEALR